MLVFGKVCQFRCLGPATHDRQHGGRLLPPACSRPVVGTKPIGSSVQTTQVDPLETIAIGSYEEA
jgi:hypothetical protein